MSSTLLLFCLCLSILEHLGNQLSPPAASASNSSGCHAYPIMADCTFKLWTKINPSTLRFPLVCYFDCSQEKINITSHMWDTVQTFVSDFTTDSLHMHQIGREAGNNIPWMGPEHTDCSWGMRWWWERAKEHVRRKYSCVRAGQEPGIPHTVSKSQSSAQCWMYVLPCRSVPYRKTRLFKALSWYGKLSCVCLFGPFGRQFCTKGVVQNHAPSVSHPSLVHRKLAVSPLFCLFTQQRRKPFSGS